MRSLGARRWQAVGVLLGCLALGPVGAGSLAGHAGPFPITVTVTPDPPVVGTNLVTVAVRDRAGRAVDQAAVTVTASMTDMAMGATPFPAPPGRAPGTYESQVDLSMAGGWALEVRVAAGGREGRETFAITTGNPVHQVAVSGRRAVWLWLAVMLGAPLLALLIPQTVLRPEHRGIVAGSLLLVAAVFLARTVVQVYKRPGQMGVIEAQAMDMTAMKPPVGLVPVVVETVRAGAFRGGVSYTGSVVPYAQQDVYPRVPGLIVSMPVYPGDRVLAGQLVARLDTRELGSKQSEAVLAHLAAQDAAGAARQEARSAAAGVDQAASEYAMAEQRIKQMAAEKASAEALVRRSQQELAAAHARLRQAQRNVEAGQAGQRTAAAMTEESRTMVRAAEAEKGSAGAMITEATEMRAVAQREVSEADRLLEAAQAAQERADAEAEAMRAELPQAQAEVARMQAELTYAQQQLDRLTALVQQGAVSQQEYDEQKSMRDQAQARLDQARAMVTGAQGRIRSAVGMVRQAAAEAAAARERRSKAEAMVRAADAKVAQARSGLTGSGAMVAQREAAVRSKAAEEEEAGSMVAMRQAEVETMAAAIRAAEEAVNQARQDVTKAAAGIAEMRAERDRAAGMIRERRAMTTAANQRAAEMANRAAQARAAAFTAATVAGYTEIRATLDGVVTERVTSPSTLVQPGMLLLRIAQIDQVRLQANVAQVDAAAIRPGAPVEVSSRKDAGRRDLTVVSAVFPAANPASRTQIVEALVDNRDSAYLPGDFITMRIASGEAGRAVLTVPTRALVQTTREGGSVIGENQPAVWVVRAAGAAGGGGATQTEYYCTMHPEVVSAKPGTCPKCKMDLTPRQVPATGPAADAGQDQAAEGQTEYYCTMHPEVVSEKPGTCPKCQMDLVPREAASGGGDGGTAHLVRVTTGRSDGGRVEVMEGLEAGDQVIVSGFDSLREGDRVQVVTSDEHAVPTIGSGAVAAKMAPAQPQSGRDRTPAGPPLGLAGDPGAPAVLGGAERGHRSRGAERPAKPAAKPAARPTPKPAATPKYACPMHPEVTSDKPGAACPKCKMDLEPVH